ncbi:hypothetical protein GW17_00045305, partial [Ensete ventricosum]
LLMQFSLLRSLCSDGIHGIDLAQVLTYKPERKWVSNWTVGYQFDYVFDWTMLKHPQSSTNPRTHVCPKKLQSIHCVSQWKSNWRSWVISGKDRKDCRFVLDSDKSRASSSKNGSISRRAVPSSSRHTSSADFSEQHLSRTSQVSNSSSSSRTPIMQRLHQSGPEPRSSPLARPAAGRSSHDARTLRSMEFLSISAERRK